DRLHNPGDNIAEAFLGAALPDDRRLYFDASPLSYAIKTRNHTAFLLAWGTSDDRINPHTQSEAFARALTQAGFPLQTVIIPRAPH
ncbi:prolyl oligopeptidase family serine peptidase, partial [Acinetobacter baumannii]